MWEAIILEETKFCELMKLNNISVDIFKLLFERTSYIHVGRASKPTPTYNIHGSTIQQGTQENVVGISIDEGHKFEEHIPSKVNKANSMMGTTKEHFSS